MNSSSSRIRATATAWLLLVTLGSPGEARADHPAVEAAIISLATGHPSQGRSRLLENSILAAAAQARADDLLARGYFSHTNPEGIGPNRIAESFGYRLPSFYDPAPDGNNIESLFSETGYGFPSASRAIEAWVGSPSHRAQVLAENSFFAEQTHVGVGVASNGSTTIYVFLSAPPYGSPVDTWSYWYNLSVSLYGYYAALGDQRSAIAAYYYYKAIGDYTLYNALDSGAAADYFYYEGIALYSFYATDGNAGLFAYYVYYAYANYFYYTKIGDDLTAGQIYRYYIRAALAVG